MRVGLIGQPNWSGRHKSHRDRRRDWWVSWRNSRNHRERRDYARVGVSLRRRIRDGKFARFFRWRCSWLRLVDRRDREFNRSDTGWFGGIDDW
jgi:hypothetical protein